MNSAGEQRKISLSEYSSSIPNLRNKIQILLNKNCIIRTSQNTASWSSEIWFSEISLDGSSLGITNPEHVAKSDYESVEALKSKLEEAEIKNSIILIL